MVLAQMYGLIAGAVVLVTMVLVHPAFLWGTVFVGANVLQSGFTNWCPMMAVRRRAGLQG
jgi:hypothetical protein